MTARPDRDLANRALDDHARELRERSYTVLPGLYPAATIARWRAAIVALYRDLGSPPLYSKVPQWPQEDLEISGTGLVIHGLLGRLPGLAQGLLEPAALAVLEGALGRGLTLEFVGAVVADTTRPFFPWHHHVGGIDDERFRRLSLQPAIEAPERVAMLVYLEALKPEAGQLLVWPWRVSGAAPPPGDVDLARWPGQRAVTGPPGTAVILDQCCWHAVTPRTLVGELRLFVGLWFAAADAPPATGVDASLRAPAVLAAADPTLQRVLPRPPEGRPGDA